MRGIDYLTSRDDVDAARIGCVGNSGGGTLTAYISALDPRVKAARIGCYITTLPRRMGNRIEADPDADPSRISPTLLAKGIDHAGLLALRAPKPTLLPALNWTSSRSKGLASRSTRRNTSTKWPGPAKKVAKVEAAERHGLSLPLRLGVYGFFERWLAGREAGGTAEELPVEPRPVSELLACPDGQVSTSFQSVPLLPLAWEHFGRPSSERKPLRELLRLDLSEAKPHVTPISGNGKTADTVSLLVERQRVFRLARADGNGAGFGRAGRHVASSSRAEGSARSGRGGR